MRLLFLSVIFLLGSVLAQAQVNPSSITIGFLPGGDAEALKKGAVAIAQAIQNQLNIPVKVYLSKDYSGLIDAMKTKKVDFAFFTSMTYVVAEKNASAKVLLKKVWVEPFYYSMILAPKGKGISKITDLKGKKIGLVDEKSTSGFLYPQFVFKKNNLNNTDFKEVKYSGSHSQSVAFLDQGAVDAIAVFSDDVKGLQSAYAKYSKKEKPMSQVNIIWVSEAIPNDPFCVRQDFYDQYPKLTYNLMIALIDAVDQHKGTREIQEAVGANALMPATQRQYDPVREMAKALDLKP